MSYSGICTHFTLKSCHAVRKTYIFLTQRFIHQMSLTECLEDCSPTIEFQRSGLSSRLRSCNQAKLLMLIHDEIMKLERESDVYLSSLVVHMYGKCGALAEAQSWFCQMNDRSVFSWNCLTNGYLRCGFHSDVNHFFEQMLQECIVPNSVSFSNMVSACSNSGKFREGMHIHALSRHSHLDANVVLQTAFISMYNKFNRFTDALVVFERMSHRDTVSWNAMLTAVANHFGGKSTITIYAQMLQEAVVWDKYTCVTLLSAFGDETTIKNAKQIHACVNYSGFEVNNVMMLALINAYAKNGHAYCAKTVFDSSNKQDVVLWNVTIAAYAQNGDGRICFQLFLRLHQEGQLPDKVTYLKILSKLVNQGTIMQGKQLHTQIMGIALHEDIQLLTELLHMHGKVGSISDASIIFNSMSEHDIVSYNAMISAFVQHSLPNDAFQLFDQMQAECLIPNNITITCILSGCTNSVSTPVGKHIHARIANTALLSDVFVCNSLIGMYCKCGNLEDAKLQFQSMTQRDTITWNTLIGGYAQSNLPQVAFQFFYQMCLHCTKPDEVTFVHMLAALMNEDFTSFNITEVTIPMNVINVPEEINSKNPDKEIICRLNEGKMLHSYIVESNLDSNPVIENALLKFYGKLGSIDDAECIFNRASRNDVLTFNAMITIYSYHGYSQKALLMFDKMILEGVTPDNVIFLSVLDVCANLSEVFYCNTIHCRATELGFDIDIILSTALANAYSKSGSFAEAKWMFDHLHERDVIAWTSLITLYAQAGNGEEALEMFWKMQSDGIVPDTIALTSALNACEINSALSDGRMLHLCITDYEIEKDIDVAVALVCMYGKCGCLDDATVVFQYIPDKDLGLWNAIIASYAQHGCGNEVFDLLDFMKNESINPDKMTFMSIFSACSRTGLLDEGYYFFVSLSEVHELRPSVEHNDCILDLLGRVGQLDQAEELISRMPFLPTAVSWAVILTACNNQVDIERGEIAMKHLVELDPHDPATYVTVSNIYAACAGEISESYHLANCYGDNCEEVVWGAG